jgi:hypothetical protein
VQVLDPLEKPVSKLNFSKSAGMFFKPEHPTHIDPISLALVAPQYYRRSLKNNPSEQQEFSTHLQDVEKQAIQIDLEIQNKETINVEKPVLMFNAKSENDVSEEEESYYD